jgi:hypothetical protein
MKREIRLRIENARLRLTYGKSTANDSSPVSASGIATLRD